MFALDRVFEPPSLQCMNVVCRETCQSICAITHLCCEDHVHCPALWSEAARTLRLRCYERGVDEAVYGNRAAPIIYYYKRATKL